MLKLREFEKIFFDRMEFRKYVTKIQKLTNL
jgi:hypothetical protein